MSPEKTVGEGTGHSESHALTMIEAAAMSDIGAQPGPEELDREAPAPRDAPIDLSPVRWPSHDENAPDYAYIAAEPDPGRFTLRSSSIETLIDLNRYAPDRSSGVIAIALRGATLPSGHEVEDADEIVLDSVRPDHRNFRCVIGFYFTGTGRLTVYSGSTVPCRRAIWGYVNGGDPSNMLPTGLHTLYVWRHKKIRPALRMGLSSENPEAGARATVLRNTNDYIIGTMDTFDLSVPLDNVHCSYYLDENSYYGARFSSWGCLTVRGQKTPSDQWAKFQDVLSGLGERTRVDLLLATGKDMALIDSGHDDAAALGRTMAALRRGSRGEAVRRLQEKIGASVDGDFGPATLDVFCGFQRRFNEDAGLGPIADGVYSRDMDARTGWGIFGSAGV